MPDRSLTCSRAGALPGPPNPPGFIDLTKSLHCCGASTPAISTVWPSGGCLECASAAPAWWNITTAAGTRSTPPSPAPPRSQSGCLWRRPTGPDIFLRGVECHRKCGEAAVNSLIARRTEFWWNERKPDQPSLWESKIELGEDLFNEIINHPVPIDMNTLMALKRCFNFQQSVRDPQVRKRNSMDCVRSQQQSQ